MECKEKVKNIVLKIRIDERYGDTGMEYVIDLSWDDEADIWVATSDDVAGLAIESETVEILMERVKLAAPELLILNNDQIEEHIDFRFNIR